MATREGGGLPDLLDALRWRWRPAVLIAAAVFAGSYLYIRALPSKYDGVAVVSIAPRADAPNSGSDVVRVIAPKYVAYVNSPQTADAVSRQVGVQARDLGSAANASFAPDTGNLTITVRLKIPKHAADAANAYADQVVAFSKSDPLLSAQIVARSDTPTAPSSPPRRLLEVAGLAIALLLGVAFSVALERGRPRMRSWRDMANLTGYPVLGRVPRNRALAKRPTEAFADPATGSAFRTLRANIEPQIREQALDVLLVTSPSKGDGKTTVAALLAEALARLGTRTLLIDADLKRPRLAKLAKLDGRPGLAGVLRGDSTLEGETQPGWGDTLSLFPTSLDPEAGDLLARRFVDVLKEAREGYDLIVIDAPPLLGADDARPLARNVGGVVLVVAAGSNADPVNEAVLALEALRAPVLGVVGNRLKESRSLYHY